MRSITPKALSFAVWVSLLALLAIPALAQTGVYQTRAEFLAESFGTEQPTSGVIWFDEEIRSIATDILGHPPTMLRMRYWYDGARTAWVIDEIGKEKPITIGVLIENEEIQQLSVLQFRESRGWEIRYPFFTRQFAELRLNNSGALSHRIDGITGATLSVRATTRSANLALVLNDYIQRPDQNAITAR
jgi:uncharacterized protein with FMN-binding domain